MCNTSNNGNLSTLAQKALPIIYAFIQKGITFPLSGTVLGARSTTVDKKSLTEATNLVKDTTKSK